MAATNTARNAGLVRKMSTDNARGVKIIALTKYVVFDQSLSLIKIMGSWHNEDNEIYFTYSWWKAFFQSETNGHYLNAGNISKASEIVL